MEIQDNKLICPKCNGPLKVSKDKEMVFCKKIFRCSYSAPMAEYLLNPDVRIKLGKTKTNGNIYFLANSQTKKFAIDVDKLNSFECYDPKTLGPFEIEKLIEVSIHQNDAVVYKNNHGTLPMIAGGVLFGSLGAVAGSIISNKKEEMTTERSCTIILKINDIRIPACCIETKDIDLVCKFINTIEILKK